jgi:hypothetical protein
VSLTGPGARRARSTEDLEFSQALGRFEDPTELLDERPDASEIDGLGVAHEQALDVCAIAVPPGQREP